jgi:hypothetical protein
MYSKAVTQEIMLKSTIPYRLFAIATLVAIGVATIVLLGTPAQPDVAHAVAPSAPASGCGAVSCTVYLPLISVPPPPLSAEVTQGVQQPDNPVTLIADRPTFVRVSLTSTVSHFDVSAWLHGTRNGVPLPGSPIAALNNPRTLKATVNRSNLNDTFNFALPSSWTSGKITLQAEASNSSTYDYASGPASFQFTQVGSMGVTVVPIAYTCTSGGSGTTRPASPYDYLVDYTYRVYPVPSIQLFTHAALPHSGPCYNGVPKPTADDWSVMLTNVTNAWLDDGSPNSYYYGLLHIYCGSSCTAGAGWVGGYKAAIGFDGFGSQHSGASKTHAHEVGHNHGRHHAPGCDATDPDPSYPYVSGGKGYIGNAAHPNYGFDINSLGIYPYSSYYDFMSYCEPEWVSDYTYEALLAYDQTHATSGSDIDRDERALLVSASIDPTNDQVTFYPVFALDVPVRLPDPGDYIVELLDASDRVIAAYPFEPVQADIDRLNGSSSKSLGFHLTLPYTEGVASVRARRDKTTLGQLKPGRRIPSLRAGVSAFNSDTSSFHINWSATDADGDTTWYLVRASVNGGATWQTIGVNLSTPSVVLSPNDFGGQSVVVDVFASDGLHTASLRLGPFAVPGESKGER